MDVFYLNTHRFLHNGFIKGIFLMDFKFCLLGHPPPSCLFLVTINRHGWESHDDVITAHAHFEKQQFSVTINRTEQEGGSPAAILVPLQIFKWLSFLSNRIFQVVLLAYNTPYYYLFNPQVPAPRSP